MAILHSKIIPRILDLDSYHSQNSANTELHFFGFRPSVNRHPLEFYEIRIYTATQTKKKITLMMYLCRKSENQLNTAHT